MHRLFELVATLVSKRTVKIHLFSAHLLPTSVYMKKSGKRVTILYFGEFEQRPVGKWSDFFPRVK